MSPVFAASFTATTSSQRLPHGGLIDRAAPLAFTFDGEAYGGFQGDTLASALMANGVRLLGRSFKYHRPRGLLAAGPEEPNALVSLRTGPRHEPNLPATTVELFEGLAATSQNRFPSLRHDLLAINGMLGPLFSAGFYYKTFMWPASFWERVYEPLIRRAAGLGSAPLGTDPDHYQRGFLHADILIVGAGPAGLAAALASARTGARIILADEDCRLGGRLLAERTRPDTNDWAASAEAELHALPNVRILTRTSVFGAYDHGTFAAVERNADHLAIPGPHQPRQTYWRVAAPHCILATGALERPLVFRGNDRPGVMLAGAVRTYLNRYAAIPGRRAVVVTAGPDGWRTVDDLQSAGIEVAAVVDRDPAAHPRPDIQVFPGGHVAGTGGRLSLDSVDVIDALGRRHRIRADLLAMAGGWTPTIALAAHTGGRPAWNAAANAFLPTNPPPGMLLAGAASGTTTLDDAIATGTRAGQAAAANAGFGAAPVAVFGAAPNASVGAAPVATPPTPSGNPPLWLMPRARGKAFVDFQHDVTADDIALAHREGFTSVEHLKRYTTLGMATDQGKLSNVNGLALMAELTGAGIAETGTTMFRSPTSPVTIGALAGHSTGKQFRPTRTTPAHEWAAGQGAVMIEAGAWLRAGWFPKPGEDWLAACTREVTATRNAAGLCDVSTLGKIELVGPDVGAFLDRLYVNTFSTLKPGRVRYGLMLREDGFVFDDGTVARLEPDRWLMTTTTAQAAAVLSHMEFCHQLLWPDLQLVFTTATDQWAQFGVAGPRARDILGQVVDGDVSDAALPYMGCATVRAATARGAVRARIFRISFSGELAFEIAVPARHGNALAQAITEAGAVHGLVLYGLEALSVMRIEKGHPAGPELNGQTTAGDLGMARMLSQKKDFIGRAMARRPALVDPGRPTLIGLKPRDPLQRIRSGAHLFGEFSPRTAETDQGWVTSAAYSPSECGWIALAMLKNGAHRLGECIQAYDPIRNSHVMAEVVGPCFVDPDGARLRVG